MESQLPRVAAFPACLPLPRQPLPPQVGMMLLRGSLPT